MSQRAKVFGVGLNKTGTTSLAEAMSILGYKVLHHQVRGLSSQSISAAVATARRMGQDPFSALIELQTVEAFFDVRAVEENFDYLDEWYPGSKYILHTRALEDWLNSRERHVRRNRANPNYRGDWVRVERAAWTEQWFRQHHRVRSYFADRPSDLLEFDAGRGDGWTELCDFLGRRSPQVRFPHFNATSSMPIRSRWTLPHFPNFRK